MPPQPSSAPITTRPLQYDVVVLAEDDPVLRRTLSDFLVSEGFLVREVTDVRSLRHAIADGRPRAFVLDVHLADDSVGGVVQELRRAREDANVVLISAAPDAPSLARTHGVQLLAKPFELDELVSALLVPLGDRGSSFGL